MDYAFTKQLVGFTYKLVKGNNTVACCLLCYVRRGLNAMFR